MPPCPPDQYAFAAGKLNYVSLEAYQRSLALAQSTNAENWVDQSYGFAERVRYAEVLADGTVYTPDAILVDATPKVTETDAEKLARLTPYHPYGLPYTLEAEYQALSNP
jgi:hypothetical protein